MKPRYPGRLGLQQRVLPSYRVPFFDLLAEACEGGLSVFAGEARRSEAIAAGELRVAKQARGDNVHLFAGPVYFCYQRGCIQWLESWNPDALIVEANARYLATPKAVEWMHARGRKVIGWGLGSPPLSGPLSGLRGMRRLQFLQHFDALIAYSQRGADEYRKMGYSPEKVFVATNAAVAIPARAPTPKREKGARPSVLFVGRLQKRKRVDWLLEACAEMPVPKPRLVIVGDGPEGEALRQLAARLYPDTEFAGAKQGKELEPYFEQADLFVLPGTGGLAVQEAMAHGLPVIVAKGDGTQDDLVRAANGWQIAAEEPNALKSTLQLALNDMERLKKMGKESYRIVAEEINLQRMVEAFVKAVKS